MQISFLRNLFPKYAVCVAAVIAPLSLHAQTIWSGTTSTDYNVGSNWSTGTVPANNTPMIIDSSAANPSIVSGDPNGGNVLERFAPTTITGSGSLTVNRRLITRDVFTVSGGQLTVNGQYFITGSGGVGTFNQSAGTVTANVNRAFALSNNNVNESGTTYNLSGGTLIVNSMTGGGVGEDLYSVYLGKGSAGAGTLVGDLFHATGGTATFTRTGTQEANVRIARNSKLQVSGGTVTFNNYNNFWVGVDAAGTTGSSVIVDGGTLNVTGATNLYLGRQDDGSLLLSSGTLNLESSLVLGGDLSGAFDGIGTVSMTGGSLFVGSIFALNPSSFFNFSGGTITLPGDQTSIIGESWFNGGSAIANYDAFNNITTIAVPEPSTFALMGIAGLGLLAFRRRAKH